MHPDDFSLRQLVVMGTGRAMLLAGQIAPLLCMVANALRDEKRRPAPYKIADFLVGDVPPKRPKLSKRRVHRAIDAQLARFPKAKQ